jgi:cell division protein FtsQ
MGKQVGRTMKFPMVAGVVVLLLAGGLLVYRYTGWFTNGVETVRQVEIHGAVHVTRDEIIALGGLRAGLKLADIETDAFEKILEMHPRINEADVKILFPDTLRVEVDEAGTSIVAASLSGIFELDEELNILSENDVRDTEAPFVYVQDAIEGRKYNGKYRRKLMQLAESFRRLEKLYPVITSWLSEFVVSTNGHIKAYVAGRPLEILFGREVNEMGLRKLHASLSWFRRQGRFPARLDLSGEDAVY